MTSFTARQIIPMALKAFSDHEIAERRETDHEDLCQYVFRKPGEWAYSFTVTLTPGWVMVHGDIGFFAASRVKSMIPWCRSVLVNRDDPSRIDWRYLAEKCPREINTKEFSAEVAVESLEELLLDVRKDGTAESQGDIDEFLSDSKLLIEDLGEQAWAMVLEDLQDKGWCDGADPPSSTDWCPSLIWCGMGLRAFILKLDAESLESADSSESVSA